MTYAKKHESRQKDTAGKKQEKNSANTIWPCSSDAVLLIALFVAAGIFLLGLTNIRDGQKTIAADAKIRETYAPLEKEEAKTGEGLNAQAEPAVEQASAPEPVQVGANEVRAYTKDIDNDGVEEHIFENNKLKIAFTGEANKDCNYLKGPGGIFKEIEIKETNTTLPLGPWRRNLFCAENASGYSKIDIIRADTGESLEKAEIELKGTTNKNNMTQRFRYTLYPNADYVLAEHTYEYASSENFIEFIFKERPNIIAKNTSDFRKNSSGALYYFISEPNYTVGIFPLKPYDMNYWEVEAENDGLYTRDDNRTFASMLVYSDTYSNTTKWVFLFSGKNRTGLIEKMPMTEKEFLNRTET